MVQRLLERWQKLSARQQQIVAAMGGLVALNLMYAVGIRPLRVRLWKLHEQVHETEERLIRATAATAKADSVLRAYEAYRPYVPATPTTATDSVKIQSHVQSEVESAVRASGVSLVYVKPAPSTSGKQTSMVSVSVEAEATPEQLVALLDLLQRSTQLLKVTELTLRAEGENSTTLRCSLVISKLLL